MLGIIIAGDLNESLLLGSREVKRLEKTAQGLEDTAHFVMLAKE